MDSFSLIVILLLSLSHAVFPLCNEPRWNTAVKDSKSIPIKVTLSPPIFNKANSPRMSVAWDTRVLFDTNKNLCDYKMNVIIILKTGQKYNLCLTSASGCTRGLPEGLCESGESELRLAIELKDSFQWEAPFGKTLREIPCSLDRKLEIVDYIHGSHAIEPELTKDYGENLTTTITPRPNQDFISNVNTITNKPTTTSTTTTTTTTTISTTTTTTTTTTAQTTTPISTTASTTTTVSTTTSSFSKTTSTSTPTTSTTTTTTASTTEKLDLPNDEEINILKRTPNTINASCIDNFSNWNETISINISDDTFLAQWKEMSNPDKCIISEYILEIRAHNEENGAESQNVVSSQKYSPASADKNGVLKAEIPLTALTACKNFTYILRAIESHKNASVKEMGNFSIPCPIESVNSDDTTTPKTLFHGWPTQPDNPTPKASPNLDSGSNSGSERLQLYAAFLCLCLTFVGTMY